LPGDKEPKAACPSCLGGGESVLRWPGSAIMSREGHAGNPKIWRDIHMKYYLLLSIAVLVIITPCASADKKDPYQHPQSSHAQEPHRKSHGPAAGSGKLPKSNTNVELAKLERQTAQIHSAPTKKTTKQTPPASKSGEKISGNKSMDFRSHQPKEHTTTTASGRVSKGSPRH
jgi:hypothetical protein